MTIEKNGQLALAFEELELYEEVKEVQKEFVLLYAQIKHTENAPHLRKVLISRCNTLLDVRENIYKILERGA